MVTLKNAAIDALDLEPIIVKSMDKEEGYGWSLDFAIAVSVEYRKFLLLCLENENKAIVPSSYVDDFWHMHILDTQKYHDDCDAIFGYFLHHFPYFGMRGEADLNNLRKSWDETKKLYELRFGVVDVVLWPSSKRCPNCGRRCRSPDGYNFDERPKLSIAS